jgi:ribosome-associated toxin RatA of RatAB toxin-antitoxin module
MPTHAEKRELPYRPEQLFDLVADIERYPEFLPWCVGARVRSREGDLVVADLVIGFKVVRERFTSRVKLDRPNLRIDVAYTEGPFRYLNNHWIFEPLRTAAAASTSMSISSSARPSCRGSSARSSTRPCAAWCTPSKPGPASSTATAPRPHSRP